MGGAFGAPVLLSAVDLPAALDLLATTLVIARGGDTEERVRQGADLGQMWGIKDERGELVAYVQWQGVAVNLQGGQVKCGLVGPGATAPGLNRLGLQTQLIGAVAQSMRSAGVVISVIESPVYGWHQRNGWEAGTLAHGYELPIEALRHLPDESGVLQPDPSLADLAVVYNSVAVRYNVSIVRDNEWWTQRILFDSRRRAARWIDENGQAVAYVVFEVLGGMGGTVRVWELFATTPGGYRGLLRYLSDFTLARTFQWHAPDDDRLCPALVAPESARTSWHPDKLVRVIDVPGALHATAARCCDVELVLVVSDDLLPDNARAWHLRVDGGTVDVRPADDRQQDRCPAVRLGGRELAPLLTGCLSVSALSSCTSAQEDRDGFEALETLLHRRRSPYLPEVLY